jgi:Protein phosphatase 2C
MAWCWSRFHLGSDGSIIWFEKRSRNSAALKSFVVHVPNMSDNQAVAETAHKQAFKAAGFWVGISEDRNKRCRRTMEDAHACIPHFGGIDRQGFFGIYDGHAGKATAEWCGYNLHKVNSILLVGCLQTSFPHSKSYEPPFSLRLSCLA